MKCGWQSVKLIDVINFNPKETLPKNSFAKKVSMEKLQPYTKSVSGFELSKYCGGTKFCNGDTIMARITPCLENGKTAYVDFLDNEEVAFGSTEFIVMRAKAGVILPQYVYYLAISPEFRKVAIQSMVGSSGRQRVQQGVLNELNINLPPLDEQKRIVAILSALDDKIELNRKINENLLEQVICIFSSNIATLSKNGQLGDYCSVKSGFAFKSSWWTTSGIKVIKIGSINQDALDLNVCSYVAPDKAEFAADFTVKGGDLLIAMTGATIGKFAMVPQTSDILLVNQRVGKFFLGEKPVEKLPFIYCQLKQPEIANEIINRGQGSAQPNISASDIMTIPCVMPTEMEINDFNETATPMFEQIIQNQLENQMLAKVRDTLLPKLISGEIEV